MPKVDFAINAVRHDNVPRPLAVTFDEARSGGMVLSVGVAWYSARHRPPAIHVSQRSHSKSIELYGGLRYPCMSIGEQNCYRIVNCLPDDGDPPGRMGIFLRLNWPVGLVLHPD